ncbi:hypothetical protein RFI_25161 [Reticulomyxa filosa]|uniref:Uncharacterized protein n=1 Tax=Reticulomyxa filosa TaxID=46433 RepID=X6MGN8_RETFI|nr:hypothetical protein RFI_25161 [Reticulomyxa filosa]|eukprot:ETO12215.1 hypothetical protein RFI_25161 [Reticulomyxa filosa]
MKKGRKVGKNEIKKGGKGGKSWKKILLRKENLKRILNKKEKKYKATAATIFLAQADSSEADICENLLQFYLTERAIDVTSFAEQAPRFLFYFSMINISCSFLNLVMEFIIYNDCGNVSLEIRISTAGAKKTTVLNCYEHKKKIIDYLYACAILKFGNEKKKKEKLTTSLDHKLKVGYTEITRKLCLSLQMQEKKEGCCSTLKVDIPTLWCRNGGRENVESDEVVKKNSLLTIKKIATSGESFHDSGSISRRSCAKLRQHVSKQEEKDNVDDEYDEDNKENFFNKKNSSTRLPSLVIGSSRLRVKILRFQTCIELQFIGSNK